LLKSGRVKHTQLSADGNEVFLWMIGSGDAVNVQPESSTRGHTCTARAMEHCKALVWENGRLQALLNQYPRIRENISRILAGRLRELEERFREVATEKVATRLALTLLRLVKRIGTHTSEGIQISLSREEMAQMTGTTLFTISRILSKWAERGIITARRESILIGDPKRLELVSDEEE
jgi:CRP-like cAMP-binding protein